MPMDKHRKIIGNIYFGLGVILLVLLALTWKNSSEDIELTVGNSFYLSFPFATIPFLAAGVALLGNFRRAHRVCLPVSILFLFSFPIGTIFGSCPKVQHTPTLKFAPCGSLGRAFGAPLSCTLDFTKWICEAQTCGNFLYSYQSSCWWRLSQKTRVRNLSKEQIKKT